MFSLAVFSTFFLPGEQTTRIIYNVHQYELNNEIKINLPNKCVLECFLFEIYLLLTVYLKSRQPINKHRS